MEYNLKDMNMQEQERVYTVNEVNRLADSILRHTVVWVEGEVCDLRLGYEGFGFFSLRDEQAVLPCVIFGDALRRLDFELVEGGSVLARGNLGVYAKRGQFRLNVLEAEESGEGRLKREYLRLFKRLSEEGLFAEELKRPLPPIPFNIGLVTSLEGAAVRDLVTNIRKRFPPAHIYIRSVRVQGEGAEEEIAQALRLFNSTTDRFPVEVIVLARGGGSLEDLHPFNTEVVARALRDSRIPVVTGIGHEPDYTIADYAADLRASTPTGAAQSVVPVLHDLTGQLSRNQERLGQSLKRRLERVEGEVGRIGTRRCFAGPDALLFPAYQHLEESHASLRRTWQQRLEGARQNLGAFRLRLLGFGRERRDLPLRLGYSQDRLRRAEKELMARCERQVGDARVLLPSRARQSLGGQADRWRSTALRLDALSPLRVLSRGYAIAYPEGSRVPLRDASLTQAGWRLEVQLLRGRLKCEVEEVLTGEFAAVEEVPTRLEDDH